MLHNVYVWLTYKSTTGSRQSKLLRVIDHADVNLIIKKVNNISAYILYENRPSWLNLKTIELSIQDLNTSEVLYRRIIEVDLMCLINHHVLLLRSLEERKIYLMMNTMRIKVSNN